MPRKGPHISISQDAVVQRMLRIPSAEFSEWPQSVRDMAASVAEELFLVACNPFIDPDMVRASVAERFGKELYSLATHYANSIGEGITMFWSAFEAESVFRGEVLRRLRDILPPDAVSSSPSDLIACASDATDLRMELPLAIAEPASAEEVSALIRLANEMKFGIVPVGGSSGMTGGAVPARRRTVAARLTRLTAMRLVDAERGTMTVQAGVITQNAVDFAARQGWLFTVDPASRTASSIGGNVAENSGGPCAFEYGTTLDNLYSWRMVTPTGDIIEVRRLNHPRHKILPGEVALFEVRDVGTGAVRSLIELKGEEIRLPGLGKDVTNKALGGLPGAQKEGVDGVITDVTFCVYPQPKYSRVMVMEFYGKNMDEAAVVIGEIVALRDRIRADGDYAKLSALEEFNAKYIQAIEYKKKANREGMPISVVIVQTDGDDEKLLAHAVDQIRDIAEAHPSVALSIARNAKEAELFWEDRHRLSVIAKRTSGFKINEDVVVPVGSIPMFSLYLQRLNVACAAVAYRRALQDVGRVSGMPNTVPGMNREFSFASSLMDLDKTGGTPPCTDDDLAARAEAYLEGLVSELPDFARKIRAIIAHMKGTRLIVATHMHAGDGNCHVNIPVNSNDAEMLALAESVVDRVMAAARAYGGAVSGEHGIGITKIAYLDKAKMTAIRDFKRIVDPAEVCNPAKLTQSELPVRPYTFSFNRLIEDIRESGLPEKDRLIDLLQSVQSCTRCGKCKQVCPMMYPERGLQYHPRNKNMLLGAVIEAIVYSQATSGTPSKSALVELRRMIEHCTGCGKCEAVCPVHIPSANVAIVLRAFLEKEGVGGHPVKAHILDWLSRKPSKRVPRMVKVAALGQSTQNKMLSIMPFTVRKRLVSPFFASKGPTMNFNNLYDVLGIRDGHVFASEDASGPAVLYFPGCGGSLFSRAIGISTLALLLKAGCTVVLPPKHLCCGYPLLAAGADDAFARNMSSTLDAMTGTLKTAVDAGLTVSRIITACGSCREGLVRYNLDQIPGVPPDPFMDVIQFVLPMLPADASWWPRTALYHVSCHTAFAGVHKVKGVAAMLQSLSDFTGARMVSSERCCGESGMGAMTSPEIYNLLRERKMAILAEDLRGMEASDPVIVSCPSCKIGIARSMIRMRQKRPVLHTAEWVARMLFGGRWERRFIKAVSDSERRGLVRIVRF